MNQPAFSSSSEVSWRAIMSAGRRSRLLKIARFVARIFSFFKIKSVNGCKSHEIFQHSHYVGSSGHMHPNQMPGSVNWQVSGAGNV